MKSKNKTVETADADFTPVGAPRPIKKTLGEFSQPVASVIKQYSPIILYTAYTPRNVHGPAFVCDLRLVSG